MMDEKDVRILRELVADARLSFREIARRTGLSVVTVASRVKELEKQRVIEGYSAILNPQKVGYDMVAIIELVISRGKLLEVQNAIAKNPNVYGVYDVTGTCDAIVIARFKSREELSQFVKSLLSTENVERTITHVALGTSKEDLRVYV